ncbi:hypothetical protein VT98_11111, partial [Candidatus Electrothrix communis]
MLKLGNFWKSNALFRCGIAGANFVFIRQPPHFVGAGPCACPVCKGE